MKRQQIPLAFLREMEGIEIEGMTRGNLLEYDRDNDWAIWEQVETFPNPEQKVTVKVVLQLKPQVDTSLWLEVSFLIVSKHYFPSAGHYICYNETVLVAARRFSVSELFIKEWVVRQVHEAHRLALEFLTQVDKVVWKSQDLKVLSS